MATMTISVADESVMESLRNILSRMSGVSILTKPATDKKKTGMEEAMDDIREGRMTEYASVDEMFDKLGI